MTDFDQWLDKPLLGSGTTRRAYYSDNQLTAARDAWEAATAAEREDALRYRWLRDVGDATWRPFGIRAGYSAEQADAAIDAAIRSRSEK